jgi:LPXTG-motif cell wall-anchored protein
VLVGVLSQSALAAPVIGGNDDVTVSTPGPTPIAGSLTVTGGNYEGGFVELEVSGATEDDQLSVATVGAPDTTEDVVSIVGSTVYLGTGDGSATEIGSVDATFDGRDGSKLRVSFDDGLGSSSLLPGGDFPDGGVFLNGDWEGFFGRVDLGVQELFGYVAEDNTSYSPCVGHREDDWDLLGVVTSGGAGHVTLRTQAQAGGPGCWVVHGPAVASAPFDASAGDRISFDWYAAAEPSRHHFYAYLVDDSGVQTPIFLPPAEGGTDSFEWETVTAEIPRDGTYRVVFVGGLLVSDFELFGESTIDIDNAALYRAVVTSAVVQDVARLVRYESTAATPPTSRTVDVTVRNSAGETDTAAIDVALDLAVPPSAPAIVTVTPADTALEIRWAAPGNDGGSPITGWDIELCADADCQTRSLTTGEVPGRSYTWAGLTNGTSHTVRVRAVNAAGNGPWSAPVDATPRTTPGAPSISRIVGADRALQVTVEPPSDDGGSPITGYEVSLDGGGTWASTGAGTDTTFTVFGLANGRAYPVAVRAVNDVGAGPSSAPVDGTPTRGPVVPNGSADEVPHVPAGEAQLLVNGEPVPVTVDRTPDGAWTLTGAGITVVVSGVVDGESLTVDGQGHVVLLEDGKVLVTGEGFTPGSVVDIWLMSTPVFVGEATVDPEGSFTTTFDLPDGLELGEHTLQLNGVADDGTNHNVALGLVVDAAPTAGDDDAPPAGIVSGRDQELPRTGAESSTLTTWALLLFTAGAALLVASRRRTEAAPSTRQNRW